MKPTCINIQKLEEYAKNLKQYVVDNFEVYKTLYLCLGVKTIRLLIYSAEFIPHLEKHLTFVLKENSSSYDATIVLWKENDVKTLYKNIAPDIYPATNIKRRVEFLVLNKGKADNIWIKDKEFEKFNPVIQADFQDNVLKFVDALTNTYFYCIKNLEPEVFNKEGHLLVKQINKILNTDNTCLVHGAVVGIDGKGVLFCARGQRGKSTLSVLSMLRGFEYVADDYLILEKAGEKLYSYPIYSIITLSPKMYNKLYNDLKGSSFVCNSGRQDKYIFNIENFHNQFRSKYCINICIFPEIVSDEKPSVSTCTIEEKGRARNILNIRFKLSLFREKRFPNRYCRR